MKLKILFCLFFVFLKDTLGDENVMRMIGGKNTKIEDYPYQISLRIYGIHFCGGSIISEHHILTAGHCVKKIEPPYEFLSVFTGTNSSVSNAGEEHKVENIDIHPEYEGLDTYYHNDLAIITLKEKIKFNEHQKKISLPTKDHVRHGIRAVITGWGWMNFPKGNVSEVLKRASVTIVPYDTCDKFFIGPKIVEKQVCTLETPGIGVCTGDSGGPLAIGDELVGVTSWVIPCGIGYPDVYIHVYHYNDWIQKIIGQQ